MRAESGQPGLGERAQIPFGRAVVEAVAVADMVAVAVATVIAVDSTEEAIINLRSNR